MSTASLDASFGPVRVVVEHQYDTQTIALNVGTTEVGVALALRPHEAAEIGEALLLHARGHTRRVPSAHDEAQ